MRNNNKRKNNQRRQDNLSNQGNNPRRRNNLGRQGSPNGRASKRPNSEQNSKLIIWLSRFIFLILASFILVFFAFYILVVRVDQPNNIVIVSSNMDAPSEYIYVSHISSDGSKNRLFAINAKEVVEVPKGYGEYSLSSVYRLLTLDKKDEQYIKATYSNLLGVVVDEVIEVERPLVNSNQVELNKLFLEEARNNFFKLDGSFLRLASLHTKLFNVQAIEVGSLEDFRYRNHELKTITDELHRNCSVAFFNTTNVSGLAKNLSLIAENTGALVVRLSDHSIRLEQTYIYYDDADVDCYQVAVRLANIFEEKPMISPLSDLENPQQYRAKVVILVGDSSQAP
jgi:hypothetical protein